MGCCGQWRDTLRRESTQTATERVASANTLPPAPVPSTRAPAPPPLVTGARPVPSASNRFGRASVRVEYTERSRILVRGPASGRTYEFSAALAVQWIDSADAAALSRTGFFRT